MLHICAMVGLLLYLAKRVLRVFSFLMTAMARNLLPLNHDLFLTNRLEVVQAEEMLCC